MQKTESSTFIHPSALVEEGVSIGAGVKIWHAAHIRTGAVIGANTIVGKNVFIDAGVLVGANCKIQNNSSLYHGSELAEGVFIGPHVCLTNDRTPRAITPAGQLKQAADWKVSAIKIGKGASIGAGTIIVAGVSLSEWCMIGAGSVVTRNIPPFALAYGVPARIRGLVGRSGDVLASSYKAGQYTDSTGEPVEVRSEWVQPEL